MTEMAETSRNRDSRSRRTGVVVEVRSGRPSPIALAAAIRLARGLEAEMRSHFLEDQELISLASLPCAREVSFSGRRTGAVSLERLRRELALASASVEREIARLARLASIPFQFGILREERWQAIESACRSGDVLVFAEPMTGEDAERAAACVLAHDSGGVLGCVCIGPQARREQGPVLVVLDAVATADRLIERASLVARAAGGGVTLAVAAETAEERRAIAEAARAALAGKVSGTVEVASVDASRGTAGPVLDLARRASAGLVVVAVGGRLGAHGTELRPLLAALDCPLFLVS
ncbi:MAG: hypothetical protein R3D33_00385 [Hyphomicrobiaceae bacterium]